MFKQRYRLLINSFFLICILLSNNALAVDPDLDWKTIESEHIYLHFADGNKTIAERALAIAESAHKRLTRELNWQPKEKTHVVISDETDQPNGFASPLFFNRTVIFLAPPTDINTLEDFDDWLTLLIFHEYTHIIHLDKSAGTPEFLRSIFGRFVFLFPNLFQPSWVLEGLATSVETDVERGIGRGQSTLFASMMREEVANGLQPISHVNLPVVTWPAGNTRYLYGVYFMNFLTERYGADKLQQWIEEYSDNLFPFFINTNANTVLGKNLTPLWEEYRQWLTKKFQLQIDAITARGIKTGKQISKVAYRTDSVRAIETEKGEEIYYVENGGYKRASLMHIKTNSEIEELADLNNGAMLDVHPTSGLLLTQNEFCNQYTIYSDIYRYDEDKKSIRRLTECGRYLFASWHPDGKQIIAVQHNAGKFELQLLDDEAQIIDTLWQAKNAQIIGQIDVAPDGKYVVASVWRKGDGWNIEVFNLANKQWKKVTRGVSIAMNPQYTADGNILFSMEADNVYNLYRYHNVSGKVEQLTQLMGGAFQSSQAAKGAPIYYTGYSAEGYAIYKLALDEPEAENQQDASFDMAALVDELIVTKPFTFKDDQLKLIDYSVTKRQENDYSAWPSLQPRWWFPTFSYSEQRAEFGVITTGADALGIHNYTINLSYDTKLEKPAANLKYVYARRYYFSYARINEILLESNGNLNRISKRDVASAMVAFNDWRIQHQSSILFSIIYDNTADDELATNAIAVDEFEDHLLGAAWLYNSADLNPLSISLNDGMQLRLVAEDSDILNADFSGQIYTIDFRQFIRTGKESVIALRVFQGWGTDQPREFRLGGEGTSDDVINILLNGVRGDGIFDRRRYALRGYDEGRPQLRGRRAQLLTGEWRFPTQRIEQGLMSPPVGIMQWFGTVFAETGTAYQNSPGKYYSSAGIEITADINLFYNLVLRTRLGYAHGFDSEIGDDRLYVKIGSSF
ncbi:MAG: hypothetical protein JKX75_00765 [Gammaproteobacteria bacterium]|nr:hypothetical protein [Gammaproteobacteria bacterium]